jgi:hypothetical protein
MVLTGALPSPARGQGALPPDPSLGVLAAAAGDAWAEGGTLEVSTDVPGAQVLLDGLAVGATPLKLERVKAGSHLLVVTAGHGASLTRTVSVRDGATTLVDLSLPPAGAGLSSEPLPVSPAGPSVAEAWRGLGMSFLQLPWAALAVGVTFGLFLTSAVLLTTTPADVPFLEDSTLRVSDGQWRAAAVTAGVLGLAVGGVAVVLLVLRLEPVDRVVDLLRAVTSRQEKGAGR